MHKQQIAWITGAVLFVHGALIVGFSNTDQSIKDEAIVKLLMASHLMDNSQPKQAALPPQKDMRASRLNSQSATALTSSFDSNAAPTSASALPSDTRTTTMQLVPSASLSEGASHHSVAATTPSPSVLTPEKSAPIELPTTLADYKNRAQPQYPRISKRLGEQGRVVVKVLIGVDGYAQKAQIAQTSGYDRLDQSALDAVLQWRYLPGQVGGVPQAMWFQIPIQFKLEND